MLLVVCEASPQHFHLRLCQTPHMKLSQPQLALDPCVTKLHDSSPATVSLLGFFTGRGSIDGAGGRNWTERLPIRFGWLARARAA
jgi:hypothetical protein